MQLTTAVDQQLLAAALERDADRAMTLLRGDISHTEQLVATAVTESATAELQ